MPPERRKFVILQLIHLVLTKKNTPFGGFVFADKKLDDGGFPGAGSSL